MRSTFSVACNLTLLPYAKYMCHLLIEPNELAIICKSDSPTKQSYKSVKQVALRRNANLWMRHL